MSLEQFIEKFQLPLDAAEVLAERYPGVELSDDNATIAAGADCIVLAVKPQVLGNVCMALRNEVQRAKPMVISIAAGVRTAAIENWLGGNLAIVRVMPNLPALLRRGVSFKNSHKISKTFFSWRANPGTFFSKAALIKLPRSSKQFW